MPFNLNQTAGSHFQIQRQRMSNWCWAASTLAICDFYNTHATLTQPKLVSTILNLQVCASGRPFPACNKTCELDIPLRHVGHLSTTAIAGPLTPDALANVLSAGTPVACQLLIPRIGGHAVIIISCATDSANTMFVRVADPSDGSILSMPFTQFRNNFRGLGGRWIRTYFTKA